jgi:ABC-2 type transport system ATP-binding protein
LLELSKSYGRGALARRAVDGVSLTVRRGEVYGFLGPNGAGKSTTIRMVLGLIRRNAGAIRIFGEAAPSHRTLRRVGSLVDGGAFYPFLSGRENLHILARTRGVTAERIPALLERVELSRDARRKVGEYSLGMKQRLGVAAALLNDPDLVILDEPANGLDAAGIQDMRVLIRGLADQGKAVFLSSHLLHEVQQLCDRVAIVAKGRLIREGTVGDIVGREAALWVEAEPADRAIAALAPTWPVTAMDGGLHVEASRAQAPDVVRALQAAGVDLYAIRPHEESLEDTFLDMTRDADA